MSGQRIYADPHARCAHRRYKLTCEQYDALIAATRGRCAICDISVARLLIDHDHQLGRWAVRGAVCRGCNALLRDVDGGRRRPTDAVLAYLANAWHLGRIITMDVQPRRPRPRSATAMSATEALT